MLDHEPPVPGVWTRSQQQGSGGPCWPHTSGEIHQPKRPLSPGWHGKPASSLLWWAMTCSPWNSDAHTWTIQYPQAGVTHASAFFPLSLSGLMTSPRALILPRESAILGWFWGTFLGSLRDESSLGVEGESKRRVGDWPLWDLWKQRIKAIPPRWEKFLGLLLEEEAQAHLMSGSGGQISLY